MEKVVSPPHESVDEICDSPQRENKLSFLHSAKLKANSILQVNSWIYNEIMGLKKKVEIMQHNQDANQAIINHLEVQMGDIPKKLKDYELNLKMLIKESGTKREQVTSSICAAIESLKKRVNEETISSEGPSKRTRQSSRKKTMQATATSAANSIQDTAMIGKEATMMIMDLQQKLGGFFVVSVFVLVWLLVFVSGSGF